MQKKSAVVIGAGIAGLSAAFYMQKSSISVTVLESSGLVGGVIKTLRENGYLAELGPNTVLESQKIENLIDDLGLGSEKCYPAKGAKVRYIVRNKQLHPLPTSLFSLLRTPLFSWSGKKKIFCEPWVKPFNDSYEESIAQFFTRRLGKEFSDYCVNPFVAGIFAGNPDKLSMLHTFPKVHLLEKKYKSLFWGQIKHAREQRKQGITTKRPKIISFANGLGTLSDSLQNCIKDVQTHVQVKDILYTNNSWQVSFTDTQNSLQRIVADYCVLAVPAYVLPHITMGEKFQEDFSFLARIRYAPISVVSLGFRKEDIRRQFNGFGALVPEKEGLYILGVLFPSLLFPNRAPEGHILLTVFVGGERNPDNAYDSSEKLQKNILHDLEILLGVQGKPTFFHHTFWERAIPQYNLGYEMFKEKIETIENKYTGLHFAGNYRSGISVTDTIFTTSTSLMNKFHAENRI